MKLDVPMAPQDLSELGDWLVMHEAWRSELPDEITEGTQIVGVAHAKGMRDRVTWTVTTWDPPHQVALSGAGKAERSTPSPCRCDPRGTDPPSVCGLSWAVGRCSGRAGRPRRAPSKATSKSR